MPSAVRRNPMSITVAELSVDEFKLVIETTVEQKLLEMLGDPDEGLELREEIKKRLQCTMEAEQKGTRGIPAQEVAARLDLEW
jgi:hypothetical protein